MSVSYIGSRSALAAFLLVLQVQFAMAKEHRQLTVKILSAKDIAAAHGNYSNYFYHISSDSDATSSSADRSHESTDHVFVEASDGNSYDLVAKNRKDILLPGTYKATIENRDLTVCEPRDGNCHEVSFVVVATELTTAVDPEGASPK